MMGQKSQTFLSCFTEASLRCDIAVPHERKLSLTISVCQGQCTGRCIWEITEKLSPTITPLIGEMLGHTEGKVGTVSHLYPMMFGFYGVKMVHKILLITGK